LEEKLNIKLLPSNSISENDKLSSFDNGLNLISSKKVVGVSRDRKKLSSVVINLEKSKNGKLNKN
jgi:hypothetical protein